MDDVSFLFCYLYIDFPVENKKLAIPLIAKDGKERDRETKTGELKIVVNGTVERRRRGSGFLINKINRNKNTY
jgi:hypothetical protein